MSEQGIGLEIAGALARFWAGGGGPGHSSLSTAMALAGFDEPEEPANKQDRVLRALRTADPQIARRLVEELVSVLRSSGVFDTESDVPAVRGLREAMARRGVVLTQEGFVDWVPSHPPALVHTDKASQPTTTLGERSIRESHSSESASPLQVFLSHSHAQRHSAGGLKQELARYGIEAFVAHDDIQPTAEWEDEIMRQLQECQALVVLVSEEATRSDWVDQECGWARGRGVPVVSVTLGRAPYGFLGRYQAVQGLNREPPDVARDLFEAFKGKEQTRQATVEGIVQAFQRSGSFEDARWVFERLNELPHGVLLPEHLDRIEDAYGLNNQVHSTFYVRDHIEWFLQRHRAAWEASLEE